MAIGNNNTNNSNLLDYIKKFIVWLPLIIGVFILIPLLFHILGWIEISSSLSLIVDYGPIFTFLATMILVSVTAHYSYSTKKIADSTEKNVEITKRIIETTEKKLWHQALLEVQKDYRSAEMMSAIATLWKFYNDCDNENELKEKFKNRLEEEKGKKIKNSLNYNRRILTHFYIHLASIHKHGILTEEMIFDWWIPSDMEMIGKFIIPLQEAAAEYHGVSKKETDFAMQPLVKLKKDCETYFEEKSRTKS